MLRANNLSDKPVNHKENQMEDYHSAFYSITDWLSSAERHRAINCSRHAQERRPALKEDDYINAPRVL